MLTRRGAARRAGFEIDISLNSDSDPGFSNPTALTRPTSIARYCDAGERIIEGIAGRPSVAAHAPRRQILLFHGIVNSRRRVLMPVPSRPGTHEISVLRLLAVPLSLASLFIAARRQASRTTPNAP